MDDLSSMVFLLLRKIPLFLVLLGGFLFALIRWQRHPRTSLLAMIGIGVYVIQLFVLTAVYYLLPGMLGRLHAFPGNQLYTVIQVVDDFVYAGVLILLMTAAFSGRAPKTVNNF